MKDQTLFKTTTLLYLRDALEKQSFEECKELVGIAKNYGAKPQEVQEVIADYIKGEPFGGRNNGVDGEENRLRSLKTKKEGK